MMKKIFAITFLLLSVNSLFAQNNGNKEVNQGNEAYRKGDFAKAIEHYNQALKINPENEHAKVNMAIAYNKSNKKEEANKLYNEALKSVKDNGLKSTINYNKGVNQAKEEKYKEAIEDFKSALRTNPNDQQARENLQFAINKMKQEQSGGGGQDNNQDKNQDNNQDNQQNQQNQNQQNQNSGMNKEQAERYLDNLREEEKNLQNKIMKRSAGQGQSENQKGW